MPRSLPHRPALLKLFTGLIAASCCMATCVLAQGAPAAEVLNGIDVLKRDGFAPLKDLRIGLITNHTGTDRERNATIDLMHEHPAVRLVALFSPEHGIRGELDQSIIKDSKDSETGLPIYSLYGKTREPQPEQLKNLDALVFDIQDIGCRFYTYISTMGNSMKVAAKAGVRFIVLDRPNPINGLEVAGPVLTSKSSFVGWHTTPVRHGMTVGELARMFNAELGIGVPLEVIRVEGWKREMWFDATGLPWINPSPNMRSLTEAALYPGIGLLETTNLSVGRGTDTPFEVIGAPWIDDLELAAALNAAGLPGVRFVPIRFTPDTSKHKGQACNGVNILLLDREACPIVDVGITIALTLHELYPDDWQTRYFNRLLGHGATFEAVKAGKSLQEIKAAWKPDFERFLKRREPFLIYR